MRVSEVDPVRDVPLWVALESRHPRAGGATVLMPGSSGCPFFLIAIPRKTLAKGDLVKVRNLVHYQRRESFVEPTSGRVKKSSAITSSVCNGFRGHRSATAA